MDAIDRWDSTPLHEAAASGQKVVVAPFLNKDVDLDAKESAGETPLHEVAS